MKTKEELNALKEEAENLNKKLNELNEDELAEVTGGKTLVISTVQAPPPDQGFKVAYSLDSLTQNR